MADEEVQLCQIFPHYAPVLAGAAERFRRYAPGLRARGVATSVITSRSDPAHAAQERIDGCVDVLRMETGEIARERDQRLYQAAAEHLKAQGRGGPRVVQTIKMDRRIFRSLWQIRRQGRALMYVSTMVEPETWGRTAFHRWVNLQMQVWSQRLFDAVVVGSPVMAAAQRRMGVSPRKLHIISHGVNIDRFQPAPVPGTRPELAAALPPNAKVCLYVGHLIPRKGVSALLQAWPAVAEKHPDAWLVLVGAVHRPTISSEQERREIETYQNALFQDLRSLPRVLHIPQQPDIQRWYQMADMFVFPSTQEGFPNALLEAMSTGLPCLTRRFMGFPEGQLGEKLGVIRVVDDAPAAWSTAMAALLGNTALRHKMGAEARDVIVRDHALDKTLDDYASLYRSLAGKA
jgi:glycosyltransferase involved in cell wall biosynthesis